MEEGESKSISVIDNNLGAAFLRAETDQKVLEETAERLGYEMPLSKVLNEKIKEIEESRKVILYDSHGDLIK